MSTNAGAAGDLLLTCYAAKKITLPTLISHCYIARPEYHRVTRPCTAMPCAHVRSVSLDISCLNNFTGLGHFVLDMRAELFRRAGDDDDTCFVERLSN